MSGETRNPVDWIIRSQQNLERAARRVAEGDLEDAVFHLQQAAELSMKGALIACGWELQKTHKIPVLIDHLAGYQIDCESFRGAGELLAEQYLAGRYPDVHADAPGAREISELLRATTPLVSFMRTQVEARKGGSAKPARLALDQRSELPDD